jgi:hypothetical protein
MKEDLFPTEDLQEPRGKPSSSWAICMKRVFEINPLECLSLLKLGLSIETCTTIDHDNVSRPQGLLWDIGPYEYKAGGVPAVPKNLRVK